MTRLKTYRTVISFFTILSVAIVSKAQSDINCGSEFTEGARAYYEANKDIIKQYEQAFLNGEFANRGTESTISIPIKAHIIRRSNGTGGLTEAQLNVALQNVNDYYVNANMSFFLCDGINYINSDDYYDYETNEEGAMTSTHGVTGLINIYFTDSVTSSSSGNGLCGYAYFPGGPDTILMNNDCTMNGSTFPHEIGHFFGLLHTHGPSNSNLTEELVDGSNCDTTGDFICDTEADPQLSYSNVNASCIYVGTAQDANGMRFDPNPNNILSYSRKECRDYFSPQQYARMYGTYLASRNYFECPSFNVDYTYSNTITCEESLTVDFTDSSTGATSWQWDVDGDAVVDYTVQNPTHTYATAGTYDVSLTVSNGTTEISTVNFGLVNVGALGSVPYNADYNDFDSPNTNGWATTNPNPNSDFRWEITSGITPSDNTGPSGDASENGDGIYAYTEASGSGTGDIAYFISPCLDINAEGSILEFAYHMFGGNVGELHVDIDSGSGFVNDVIPAIVGQQQTSSADDFITQQVDLSSYNGQTINVRFRAVRGNGFEGDIAIDNFDITSPLSVNEFDSTAFSVYPNPVKGGSLFVKTQFTGNLTFEITNLLGQKLEFGAITNKKVDVERLSAGTYFLTLISDNGKAVKKFIKQ